MTFVCIRNRVRSTVAERYLAERFSERAEKLAVSSAGFMPQALKNQLGEANIPFSEPFCKWPISEMPKAVWVKKGFAYPKRLVIEGTDPGVG